MEAEIVPVRLQPGKRQALDAIAANLGCNRNDVLNQASDWYFGHPRLAD